MDRLDLIIERREDSERRISRPTFSIERCVRNIPVNHLLAGEEISQGVSKQGCEGRSDSSQSDIVW
jgi:hypothetical protein